MTKMKSYRFSPLDQLRLNKMTERLNENETQIIKSAIRYYYRFLGETIQLPTEDDLIREAVSKLEP